MRSAGLSSYFWKGVVYWLILVLIFAGVAMSFPVATAITIIIFIGIAFLINGIARIIQGFTGKHSGASRAFLIGVGVLAIALFRCSISISIFWCKTSWNHNWNRTSYNWNSNDLYWNSRKERYASPWQPYHEIKNNFNNNYSKLVFNADISL